ncbi:MAG: AmmeMemoRadiSam system radical SAM enzyme [Clostridiales bacterium]|nr:AmmeMemoRadiSam system radical SAM enzyme [Clostridiales bacterium]
MIHDALYWESEGNKVRCFLCPHHCLIGNGKSGICSVRTNQDGMLKTINYGEIASMSVDPIEKKPLYHFHPGKRILSVGTFGCNFICDFCQNYSIAQFKGNSEFLPTEQLVASCTTPRDNIGIAFTYNEPTIWFEYVLDAAKNLKEAYPDMKAVLITNGYISEEALKDILPYIDAMNIDLKSSSNEYYKKICGGALEPVKRTIETAYRYKCHIELTTLVVNGLNDSMDEIDEISSWLSSIDKSIPLHLSRYYPAYKMTRPATDTEVMLQAREKALKRLNYVYLGNMSNVDNSTCCPECGEVLIERDVYSIKLHITEPVCPSCGSPVSIRL